MGRGYVTTLEVKPKSVTLNRDDIKALCEIVLKAVVEGDEYAHVRFTISGKEESVSSRQIEELMRARWPSKFNKLNFRVDSRDNNIDLDLDSDGLMGYNRIVISSSNTDWVSARVRELETFISDHRNAHWFFQNWPLVAIQILAVWLLLLAATSQVFGIPADIAKGLVGPLGILVIFIYFGIAKLYPFTVVDSGLPSISKKIRKTVAFLLLAVVTSLIGILISKLF